MIQVTVNGKAKELQAPLNLQEAIVEWEIGHEKFAVAVNNQFVAKPDYANIHLRHGDRVEILIPMQGG
ncbi:MAG: sulfur carrier protein [Cellvibrionaceae bacterium]|jgi:sulfur carrier protein